MRTPMFLTYVRRKLLIFQDAQHSKRNQIARALTEIKVDSNFKHGKHIRQFKIYDVASTPRSPQNGSLPRDERADSRWPTAKLSGT